MVHVRGESAQTLESSKHINKDIYIYIYICNNQFNTMILQVMLPTSSSASLATQCSKRGETGSMTANFLVLGNEYLFKKAKRQEEKHKKGSSEYKLI